MSDRPSPDDGSWIVRLSDPVDPLAASDCAAVFLPVVQARLRASSPGLPEEFYLEAAGTALLDFLKRPAAFDPARRSLAGYLVMAAAADLKNLLRKEARYRPNLRVHVELDELPGNEPAEAGALRFEDFPDLMAVRDALPPPERAALDLMRQGERNTASFAAVLGLMHLPPDVRQAEVKRVKDRVLKRLQRAAGGEGP
jgi:DNA-directed RNA polymerase specialized sigma24 family protein